MNKIALILVLLVSVVGCDQATKSVVRDTISSRTSLSYLWGTVRLQRAQNPGAFLSMGESLSPTLRFIVFTIFVGASLLVGLWLLFRLNSTAQTIGLTLVVGGGIGNLIDRILYGSVTDFLNFGVGPYLRTGILNIADMAIVFGVLLIALGKSTRDIRTTEQLN